jgi:acyl-CoA thioester hydrolase
MYGHLNNSIYAFLFDSVINTYLITHCGLNPSNSPSLSADGPPKTTQIGLVVSSYCDYFASVSFPDVLDLCLRVSKLGKSSVTYEVGVFRRRPGRKEVVGKEVDDEEEAVKVVGGFTHVFVEREGMRPAPGSKGMDPGIRKGLEALIMDRRGEERTSKL